MFHMFTVPLTTITEDDERKNWEDVTLLQVEAKRVYVTYKRYRKIVSLRGRILNRMCNAFCFCCHINVVTFFCDKICDFALDVHHI